jgi:amino acid adenylation domain-containing protein
MSESTVRPAWKGNVFASSPAQERIWFLENLQPGGSSHNIPWVARLDGPLDLPRLRDAFASVVARHEALRTRLLPRDGTLMQVVDASSAVEFTVESLETDGGDHNLVRARLEREAAEPFDLSDGPLIRALLLVLGETEHIVMLTAHHIIADGWSMGIIVRELSSFYRGEGASLPEVQIHYADIAGWQRVNATDQRLARSLDYWRGQLKSVEPLNLPADRPHPPMRSGRGALHLFRLPALLPEIEVLSRAERSTVFVILLSAFQALLARYSGKMHIPVGIPMADRGMPELAQAVGMLVNTVLLLGDLTGDPTFRELVTRTRRIVLDAHTHRGVPFERLVEEVQPARDLSQTTLFQVMFAWQESLPNGLSIPGIASRREFVSTGAAKFDLTLELARDEVGLFGQLEYNIDIFDAETVERLVAHYGNLLRDIVRRPEARISELALLSAAEREELINGWRAGGRAPAMEEGGLVGGFVRAARQHGSRIAVQCGTERMTYAELDAASNRLGHYLRQRGVGPEVCVGLCVEPSCELVVGILGILKAGGAYVALDPSLPAARRSYALRATRSRLQLVSTPDLSDVSSAGAPVIRLNAAHLDLLACSPEALDIDVPRSCLFYVIPTSGSTGEPKAAGAEHRGFENLIHWYTTFDFSPTARTLVISSPAFDLTQKNLFAPLLTGGEIHFPLRGHSDPRAVCDLIGRVGITALNCTPSAFYSLLEATEPQSYANLRSLRHVFLGGEPIAMARLRPWIESLNCAARIFNTYGPTECTDVVSMFPLDPASLPNNTNVPIGWPLPNTTLSILDRHLQPVPINVEGELCIHGAAVGRGYLNDARLTASRFCPDPFASDPGLRLYRTGDRVRRRRDGRLEFLGRSDRQLKVRGFRIEPGEIENAIERHSAVRRAAVTTWDKGRDDVQLAAYFVHVDGTRVTPRELRDHLCELLPDYMIPSAFVRLEALPLTASGKLDYGNLPSPDDEHRAREDHPLPPRTQTECRLASIWSSLLGVSTPGTNDDFFTLGGHSLLALQLASRVAGVFGFELPLPVAFERSTIAALAEYIDAAMLAAVSPAGMADETRGDIEQESI